MVNFDPLTAEIRWRVSGTPANFNRFHILASLLQQRRSLEANQTAGSLAVSWASILYIHFWGLLPPDGNLLRAKFTLHSILAPILAALLHGTPAVGFSQTLWRGTRNGITELSQRAPPILG